MSRINLRITKRGSQNNSGLAVFTIVKNEEYFLPHFFEHYQNLGVNHFIVYNDNSTDGTAEILSRQPNCTVVASDHQFGEIVTRCKFTGTPRKLSNLLKEAVPDSMLAGKWSVVVDADEFMILPPGFDSLPQFIHHLEMQGQFYATAPMVDFYPQTLNHQHYDRQLSPFAGCPYFDAGPLFTWIDKKLLPHQYARGIRYRLLKILEHKHPEILRDIYGKHPIAPAKTWKVPLLKQGKGIERIADHEISIPPSNNNKVALAHFKFYPDMQKKITDALENRQYYNGSMEYRFMKAAMNLLGDASLVSAETRKYINAQSLVDAGHISPGNF